MLLVERASVRRSQPGAGPRFLLSEVDWRVEAGEHWALLGPNGAGKTTLLRLASAQLLPSGGAVSIFGGRRGRVHVDRLRPRIGVVERGLADRFWPGLRVLDVVLTGVTGTIALLADRIEESHHDDARRLLRLAAVEPLAEQLFVNCSEGERTRVLLARALMSRASLLVLDEPGTGLDLSGREVLLAAMSRVAREHPELATVTATQHLEELAPVTSHVLLLRAGRVVAAGPVAETLTDEKLSDCFGLHARIEQAGGRYFARVVDAPGE